MPTFLYLAFETIALLILIIQYKKLEKSVYIYFLPYLLFIVIYECASVFNLFNIHGSNAYITNIVITVEFAFYSFFLISLISRKLKRLLTALVIVCLLFTLVDVFFLQGFWNLCTIAILVQYVMLIVLVCCFFYQLMNSSGQSMSLLSLPHFWVNTGLLFFCLAEFLFFAAFAYMASRNNYHYYLLSLVIANMANLILYSCLSISFLCFSKTKKLSP
ncbi:hypothetical protein [Mucilaginibacter gynuensis]|uniref:hypothetical protein n=1 Tax=Mucilaginibacter gynuensis TaxID=1302236 RepID=UPI0031EC4D05